MNKPDIVIRQWNYKCGDGCCTDYGCDLTINGKQIDRYFNHSSDLIVDILQALGITEYVIEEIDDTLSFDETIHDNFWDDEEDTDD